jgi:predicted methyltransferase
LVGGFTFSILVGCGGASPEPGSPATPPTATASSAPVASASAPPSTRLPNLTPYQGIVDSAERDDADKKLDEGRHPAELLAFIGVKPGMHVAELGAGGGYMSELLARVVGPTGVVYAQNPSWLLQRYAEKPWSERLSKPVMKNVVRVDREFDDPFPKEAHDLDAVTIVLFYHDTVWSKVDRDRMNRAVFAALKPGGVYVVVDHNARDGVGVDDTQSLHRIEEKVVREEIPRAGFKLAREADFLRNPSDTRDWNASPKAAGERRGTSDRFVLEFVKP